MTDETQPVRRGPGRPPATERDMRPDMRSESLRRAEARAASLRDSDGLEDEGEDRFRFDRNSIPEGWDYEWKRDTLLNKEDPAYQVELARKGWEPVPADRHPDQMPVGWKGKRIEREGMVLMERPLAISEDAKAREYRKARMQVRQKEEQLNAAPNGAFDRVDAHGRATAKVKHSYEPMEIPD